MPHSRATAEGTEATVSHHILTFPVLSTQFMVANRCKNLNGHPQMMDKLNGVQRKAVLAHGTMRINLKNIMLSERSHSQIEN